MRNLIFFLAAFFLCVISTMSHASDSALIQCYNLTPYNVSMGAASITPTCWQTSPIFVTNVKPYNATASVSKAVKAQSSCTTGSFTVTTTVAGNTATFTTLTINYSTGKFSQGATYSTAIQTQAIIIAGAPGMPDSILVYVYLNPANWMTKDSSVRRRTLNSLTIPGAHDAAMSTTNACTGFASKCNTQTQRLSFTVLLNTGVRMFDMRPVITDSSRTIQLGHYSWVGPVNYQNIDTNLYNQGCSALTLLQALSQFRSYLSSHAQDTEVLILEFSHFMDVARYNVQYSYFDSVEMAAMVQQITDSLKPFLYLNHSGYLDTPINRIASKGSRVIVVIDSSDYHGSFTFNGSQGLYTTPSCKCNSSIPCQSGNFFNCYSDTSNLNAMMQDQWTKLNENNTGYFSLSWTLTQNFDEQLSCTIADTTYSILNLADTADAQLYTIPPTCATMKKYPEVLYTDAIDNRQVIMSMWLNNIRRQSMPGK